MMEIEESKTVWVFRPEENRIISIPDEIADTYAEINPDKIVFEAELVNFGA